MMKIGDVVNAVFNGATCLAEITGQGEIFEAPFFNVVLLTPCEMSSWTVPVGYPTWVWPEMITPVGRNVVGLCAQRAA